MEDPDNSGNALLLGTLEEFLDCGGWCSGDDPKFLKFTDINYCVQKGIKSSYSECYENKGACYDKFKDFLVSKGNMMGAGSIIAGVVCLANMIMICCICNHPNNRGRKRQNFYARMMEADWRDILTSPFYLFFTLIQ